MKRTININFDLNDDAPEEDDSIEYVLYDHLRQNGWIDD